MADRMQIRLAALCESLRDHRCIVDGLMTVGECVDCGRCGCTDGLILAPLPVGNGPSPKGEDTLG